jgi:hypothetical protein
MNNIIVFSVLYLFGSVAVFLAFNRASKRFSGPQLKPIVFWCFFALSMFWGMVQFNVARHGYILFIPSSAEITSTNYLVRWVAFISAVLQTVCIPSKEIQPRWFFRK